MRYKIGIDLSTTNTGIVVLDNNNELVVKADLQFRTFGENNHHYNFNSIVDCLNDIHDFIKDNCDSVIVGIELANFKNALLTSRFSLYAGGFIT